MVRLCYGLLCGAVLGCSPVHRTMRHLEQVRFREPVEVLVRLHHTTPPAEYRLVMEASLLPHLDTLSVHGMLLHPGIYFSQLYTGSVPGTRYRQHYTIGPATQGSGLYPFNTQKVNVEPLAPRQGRYYTRKEKVAPYNQQFQRKDASDFGPTLKPNTLPGVDSVRVLYVIKIRERWKRVAMKKGVHER